MGPHTLRNPSSIGEDRKPVPVNMSLIHYSHTTQKERIINVKIIRKEEDARKRTPHSGYRLLILDHVFIDIIYIYIYTWWMALNSCTDKHGTFDLNFFFVRTLFGILGETNRIVYG